MGADRGSSRSHYNVANTMWKELKNSMTRFYQESSGEIYPMDPRVESEMYRHYDLAAMQGHHGGLYMKGVCYAGGIGVEKDYVEARRCFERAAAITGHWQQGAIEGLARLDTY